jgi:AraC family transcriptional regulator
MTTEQVRIVSLPPMRVASFYAFGESPETAAWDKMVRWAKSHSLWLEPPDIRVFGFNNPDPAEGSPNYGYEFWLTSNHEILQDEEMKIKQFTGGLYAVMHCDVPGDPGEFIPSTWGKLVEWHESSHYQLGNHQWLEEHLSRGDTNMAGFVLDLFLPISK